MGKRKSDSKETNVQSVCEMLKLLENTASLGQSIASLLELEFERCLKTIGLNEKRFILTQESATDFTSSIIRLGYGEQVPNVSFVWEMTAANGTKYTVETSINTLGLLENPHVMDETDIYDTVYKYKENKKYKFDFTMEGGAWTEIKSET